MVFKSIIGATCTCLAVVSFNANAAIISTDWKAAGDNLITRVTDDTTGSGLEWLDLTATTSRSYNDISSKLGSGQEFDGWRYASITEISGFFDAFGGDSNYYYSGWSTQNNGLFDAIAPYWGDTYCASKSCNIGEGQNHFVTGDVTTIGFHRYGYISDVYLNIVSTSADFVDINVDHRADSSYNVEVGHALIRDVSAVPIPSAVWLFGSGLISLIGIARRKTRA